MPHDIDLLRPLKDRLTIGPLGMFKSHGKRLDIVERNPSELAVNQTRVIQGGGGGGGGGGITTQDVALAVHLPGTIDDGANQGNIERVGYVAFTANTIYARFRVAPTFSANTHQIIVKIYNSADVQQGATQTITLTTTTKTYTHTISGGISFPLYGYFTVEIEHSAAPTTKGADLSVAVIGTT